MAQKSLNKNMVVGLTLFGFACMIFASFLMLRNLRNVDPKHFTSLAEKYAAEGQFREAAMFYSRAWLVSQDPAYLVPHGDMLLQEGEVAGALNAWSQALIKRPDLIEAQRKRVSLLLEIGRLYGSVEDWRRAREAADALAALPNLTPEDQALALHVRGLALTSIPATDRDSAEKGLTDLAEARRLVPDRLEFGLELARKLVAAGKTADGDALFQELIKQYSAPGAEAATIRTAYAAFLAQPGPAAEARVKEVEALHREAVTLAAGQPGALYDANLAYAMHLAQDWQRAANAKNDVTAADDLFTQAENTFKQCIESDAKRFEGYIQLATLYRARQRHEDVVPLCEKRLTQEFSRKGLQAAREKLFTFQLMIMASDACLAHATRAQEPLDAAGKEEWLKRAEQFADDAAGEFRAHPRVRSQYGRIKLAQGKDREALEELRAAEDGYLASDVIDWENKLILARLHLRLKEPGAAKQVLDRVIGRISGPAGVPFWLLYAQTLVLSNDGANPQLNAVLAEVQRFDPDNVEVKRIRATILERQGKIKQAGELIDSISTTAGLEGMAALLHAREKFVEGDPDAGLAVLIEELKKTPAQPLLVNTTVQELLARGRGAEAREVVAAALKEKPDDRRLQQLAVAAQADLSPEQRRDSLRKVIESEPDAFQRQLDLADFWMREGDDPQALAALTAAEKHLLARDTEAAKEATRSQHREILKARMVVAGRLKDTAVMDETRESATKHDVDGCGGKTILGMYHMLREEWDTAILAWRAAIAEQPTHTRSLASLAQCLHQTGDLDEAADWYQKALDINPEEAAAHRGLALLARQSGDRAAFLRHLTACERLIPNDPWVAAESALRKEEADPKAALARREAQLKDQPDDVVNLARLALLSEVLKDTERGDRYYAQLMTLRHDDRDVVVQAGKYFRRTGRPERALEVTQRFVEGRATPNDRADAMILVAAHYLNQEALDNVEKTLLEAAKIAETFEVAHSLGEFYLRKADHPEKALPWYDKAVDLARRDKPAKLPMVLASRIACALSRGVDDREKARTYIEQYRREFPEDPRAFLWESDLLVREGRIEDSVAAITQYLAKRPNDAFALYQRARLQTALGRLPAATEDLESIRRSAPRALGFDPRLLLARLHEQSGRADLAVRELEALAADAPQSDRIREALIEGYIRAQRFTDADRVATAQINRTDVQPDFRWYFLRARNSLSMKDSAKALADMQKGAEVAGFAPDRVADVLDLYARIERYAEGIDYYQKHASEGNRTPRLASRYALLLARAGRTADAVRAFRAAMDSAMSEGGDVVRVVTADLNAAFADPAAAVTQFEADPPAGAPGRANDRILVRLYRLSGRLADATARLDKLVASAPNDRERAELLLERGELHQVAGDAGRARESFEEALKHEPSNWIILNNLAYLLSDQLGAHEAALPHAKAAVRSVESADTLDTLGWVYVQLGRYPAAIAELSRAVQFTGAGAPIYYHLGEAYRRNRQFKDALDVLRAGKQLADAAGDAATAALLQESLERAEKDDAGTGTT